MIKIKIDGTDYEVNPGKNLLHTCLSLGFNIPYFCYHPAFGSVGACRQCAVKKFTGPEDRNGKIIMSCMEPVVDGLIISTDDPEVKAFRAAVIEGLMTNHPHDCPVCDEGGECHLQDMTVMTGHNYRQFTFKKRTYVNQYLGPWIHHEMNRCIQCYRCVRFYRDYSGGKDFDVFGSANHVYFGRHREGRLESQFSGNLVEVCPTGVFTDKTLRDHYTRKWDLTSAPSICRNCSLGCNILVSERYGSVRRILSRYNGAVNGYFICDRGRFSYEFINSSERIREIEVRSSRNAIPSKITYEEYRSVLTPLIKGRKIIGVGSPGASLESNYALEMLAGKDNFYHGISSVEFDLVRTAVRILRSGVAHSPSLKDIERTDAILILGEDISETAPMMELAVRQASRNKSFESAARTGIPEWNDAAVRKLAQDIKSPVIIASTGKTGLDNLAEIRYNGTPAKIAGLGKAIASSLMNEGEPDLAGRISRILLEAENPVIITGMQNKSTEILLSAEKIAAALHSKGKKASLSIVFSESNSLGLGLMDGRSLDDLEKMAAGGNIETLVILENDLYKRNDPQKIKSILDHCGKVIVLGSLPDETMLQADIVLPAGTFAESTGTLVNNEGRAQRFYRVLPENGMVKDSWKYISGMLAISGGNEKLSWNNFDDLVASLVEAYPFFARIKEIPDSGFLIYNEKIARQTLRFSGRTAMYANVAVSEPKPPEDQDSPLNFSMEGFKGVPPSPAVPYYWSPAWNSVQAMNKYMDQPGGNAAGGNPGVPLFE